MEEAREARQVASEEAEAQRLEEKSRLEAVRLEHEIKMDEARLEVQREHERREAATSGLVVFLQMPP